MKILLIGCAPRRPSLGETLGREIEARLSVLGHEVLRHELYEEGFDPVMDGGELDRGMSLDELVQAQARDLEEAGGLVIIHPDWWGQPPAILKGWVDRVFREGSAWELVGEDGGEKVWKGLLRGRRALVCVTSDSDDPRRPSLFTRLWDEAVLGACGMETSIHFIGSLRASSSLVRRAWMDEGLALAGRLFPQA
jgi:putative NADPH-quinone reductase